jgi:hypothetical protein
MATGIRAAGDMRGFRDVGIGHPIRERIGAILTMTITSKAGECMRDTGIARIMVTATGMMSVVVGARNFE